MANKRKKNTGRWYNGITSVSKTENRSSILRRSAALILLLVLFVGCSDKPPTNEYRGINAELNDHMHYPALVVFELDKDQDVCACFGEGKVIAGNTVIYCPYHSGEAFEAKYEDEPSSLSDTPFQSRQVPSE